MISREKHLVLAVFRSVKYGTWSFYNFSSWLNHYNQPLNMLKVHCLNYRLMGG